MGALEHYHSKHLPRQSESFQKKQKMRHLFTGQCKLLDRMQIQEFNLVSYPSNRPRLKLNCAISQSAASVYSSLTTEALGSSGIAAVDGGGHRPIPDRTGTGIAPNSTPIWPALPSGLNIPILLPLAKIILIVGTSLPSPWTFRRSVAILPAVPALSSLLKNASLKLPLPVDVQLDQLTPKTFQ